MTAIIDGTVRPSELEKGPVMMDLFKDPQLSIRRAIVDKEPKERVDFEKADRFSESDWTIRLEDELRICKTSDDPQEVWDAIHQIRYLATAWLLSEARKELAQAS